VGIDRWAGELLRGFARLRRDCGEFRLWFTGIGAGPLGPHARHRGKKGGVAHEPSFRAIWTSSHPPAT